MIDKLNRAQCWLLHHFECRADIKWQIDLISDMMCAVLAESTLNQFFRLERDHDNIEFKFDGVKYESAILPLLIDKVAGLVSDKLRGDDFGKLKLYLSGDRENTKFQEAKDFCKNMEESLQLRAGLMRHLLHATIPIVLSARLNVDYGLCESKTVVPFQVIENERSIKPLGEAQFVNHQETLLYTMLCYMRALS